MYSRIDEVLGVFNGKNQKRAARNTAAGLGLGIVLGAVAGLLFAPKSGKETREDIRVAAEKGAETVKETVVKGAEVVKETAEKSAKVVKETAVTGAKIVRETAQEVAGKAKKLYAGMKQNVGKTDRADDEPAKECEDEDVQSAEF
jgi:gas vesicle protein